MASGAAADAFNAAIVAFIEENENVSEIANEGGEANIAPVHGATQNPVGATGQDFALEAQTPEQDRAEQDRIADAAKQRNAEAAQVERERKASENKAEKDRHVHALPWRLVPVKPYQNLAFFNIDP